MKIGAADWQLGLGDYVGALAVSPDGGQLVAGSLAGDAVLVDVTNGEVITKLADHAFGVLAVAWSPDGAAVAVGGHDHTVRLYDRAGAAGPAVAAAGWVAALAWSPDGSLLGIGSARSLLLVRPDGEVVQRFDDVTSTVTAVAWSPDGKRVGITSYGGVTWYNPADGTTSAPIRRHEWKGSLLTLALAPNGRWACAGAQDASIHLWRLWSGDDLSMSGYPAKIEHLAFRHDSRWMASACLGEVTVWDFGGKGPAGSRPASAEVHDRHISALCWQPSDDVLASGGADGQVVLWPSPRRQGQRLQPLATADDAVAVASMAWHPAGSGLVIGRADGGVERRRVDAPS